MRKRLGKKSRGIRRRQTCKKKIEAVPVYKTVIQLIERVAIVFLTENNILEQEVDMRLIIRLVLALYLCFNYICQKKSKQ